MYIYTFNSNLITLKFNLLVGAVSHRVQSFGIYKSTFQISKCTFSIGKLTRFRAFAIQFGTRNTCKSLGFSESNHSPWGDRHDCGERRLYLDSSPSRENIPSIYYLRLHLHNSILFKDSTEKFGDKLTL